MVEPGEATELADQLQALAGDPARGSAMGRNCRRLYERQFGLERSLEQYDHLLQAVGSAPPPGPNRRS